MKLSPAKTLDGFVQLLRSCIDERNLERGRLVHGWIIASQQFRDNTLLANQLIAMYTKCGSFNDAIDVFNSLKAPDNVSWNSLITVYAKARHLQQAAHSFKTMPWRDFVSWNILIQAFLDSFQFENALKIVRLVPQFNTVAWNSFVSAYAQAGHLLQAKYVFDFCVVEKDRLSWNTILIALAGSGQIYEASDVFTKIPRRDVLCCNAMIAAYGRTDAEHAKNVFDQALERDIISWNTLLRVYARFNQLQDADIAMEKMPSWDAVSCTTILSAYTQAGHIDAARSMFDTVPKNVFSWNAMIAGYLQRHDIDSAIRILAEMPEKDVITWNTMITGLAANGHLTHAKEIFDSMQCRDATSWGSILAALAAGANGSSEESFEVFRRMPQHDLCSWNALVGTEREDIAATKEIFHSAKERNVVTWTSLICATCRDLDGIGDAEMILERMPAWDVVCLNAMIGAHCQCGNMERAKSIFDGLPERSALSWNAMLQIASCEDEKEESPSFERTRETFFNQMPAVRDVASWTILLNAYARSWHLAEAKKTFDLAPKRSLFTWNVMLLAYTAVDALVDQVLQFFKSMPERDIVSHNAVVAAVAAAGHFEKAAVFLEAMPRHCAASWNALLLGCASHGILDDSKKVFARIPYRNIISWNALLDACARNGRGELVLELLRELCLDGSAMPDEISFTHVLAACTHIGLVEISRNYFVSLWSDYGVVPDQDHYCSMVNVLCRCGQLKLAEELINSVPCRTSGSFALGSLLAACHINNDVERASQATMHTLFNDSNAAHYIIISNILSS